MGVLCCLYSSQLATCPDLPDEAPRPVLRQAQHTHIDLSPCGGCLHGSLTVVRPAIFAVGWVCYVAIGGIGVERVPISREHASISRLPLVVVHVHTRTGYYIVSPCWELDFKRR